MSKIIDKIEDIRRIDEIEVVANAALHPDGDGINLLNVMKPVDPKAPKSLVIYYGYPIAYKNMWDTNAIIQDISSHYDIFIVGDGYEDSAHEEYASTTTIINGLIANNVEIYGYVPLGVTTENRDAATLKTQIDNWNTLNVSGVFLDEFGFDYHTSRERQNDIVSHAHSVGLKYIANAWIWEHFSIDDEANLPEEWASDDYRRVDFEDYNPNNIVLLRNPDDGFLVEDFCVSNTGMGGKWDFMERCMLIINSNPNNYDLHSIAVYPEDPAGTVNWAKIAQFDNMHDLSAYIWMNAYILGLTSTGGNGLSFGSNGNTIIDTPIFQLPPSPSTFNRVLPVLADYSTAVLSVSLDDNRTTLSTVSKDGEYDWNLVTSNLLDGERKDLVTAPDDILPVLDGSQLTGVNSEVLLINDIYSEEEVKTNKFYMDKPVYRKVVKHITSTTNDAYDLGLEDGSNIDYIILEDFRLMVDNGAIMSGTCSYGQSDSEELRGHIRDTKHEVYFRLPDNNDSYTNKPVEFIIEYTKTTDTTQEPETFNIIQSEMPSYSIEEVLTTERWIDGKPIYRKVIDCGSLPDTSIKYIDVNIEDFENAIDISGIAINTNDNINMPLPSSHDSHPESYNVNLYYGNNQIVIGTNEDRTTYDKTFVTIEYTKTTDTAESPVAQLSIPEYPEYTDIYSTEETLTNKVWMGKAVYRKVLTGITDDDANDIEFNPDIGEVENCKVIDFSVLYNNGFNNTSTNTLYDSDSGENRSYCKNDGSLVRLKVSKGNDTQKNAPYTITIEYTKI